MVEAIFLGALLGLLLTVVLGAGASTFAGLGERFWRAATWAAVAATGGTSAAVWLSSQESLSRDPQRSGAALGLLAASMIVAVGGLRRQRAGRTRRRAPGRRGALASSSGLPGAGALAVVIGGMFALDQGYRLVGGLAIGVGGAVYLGTAMIEIVRGRRIIERVQARMTDARPWPLAEPPSEEGANPWEDDRVTGLWGEARVWAALVAGGAVARVDLTRWPADLGAHGGDGGAATGDDAFDRRVVLEGDEAAWRPILNAAVRRWLVRLIGEGGGLIAAGQRVLECHLSESHVAHLPALLDDMAALAAALPESVEDARAAVLELAATDPLPAVRLGHYRWLETQRWNTAAVLRAAAADADPDIAAWARERLPPEGGVYR